MSFSTFPIHPDIDPDDPYAQETLEALRHAINNNNNNDTHASTSTHPILDPLLSLTEDQQRLFGTATQSAQVDNALKKVEELSKSHVQTLEKLDVVNVLGGMISGLAGMLEGIKKQGELVKGLSGQMGGDTTALASVDPTLARMFVARAEYDELKAKYDELLASVQDGKSDGPKTKKRRLKRAEKPQSMAPELEEGEEKAGGRKRRSFKLEHLVHQMANRRLGLEYLVTNFRVVGSTTLPDPTDPVPPVHMSANGVQEFRPDWTKDKTDTGVEAFIQAATGDAWDAWVGGVGEGEEGVDMDKIREAVETYWVRLQKRWLEQQARERGETHKDALTRKKQNQYRRQQSLVGRRLASFDASPLNSCRLRALYRTLLTIDFAAATNERPDPTREYTEDQWNAYRRDQLGNQASQGHEVIDLFWLSPAARSILILLDIFSTARSSALRRKGKPKAPAPLFHLPPSLWDRSSARLPLLRPKDDSGLPQPGTPGIILFRFHVHPDILSQYPEWAEGLYDDPPIPDSDTSLQSLKEVIQYHGYSALLSRTKRDKTKMEIKEMTDDQVQEILLRPEELDIPDNNQMEEEELIVPTPPPGSGGITGYTDAEGDTDFDMIPTSVSALDPYITMSEAEARLALQAANDANFGLSLPGVAAIGSGRDPQFRENTPLAGVGVGVGTSAKSRKQGRKGMSQVPEGAAKPVAKRQRTEMGLGSRSIIGVGAGGLGLGSAGGGDEVDGGVGKEIEDDLGFLD